MNLLKVDLGVIGAGSAGLSATAFAAKLGVKVVLVERARMGGECLDMGCVPSKALLAAAKVAHAMRNATRLSIAVVEPQSSRRSASRQCTRMCRSRSLSDDDAPAGGGGPQSARRCARPGP